MNHDTDVSCHQDSDFSKSEHSWQRDIVLGDFITTGHHQDRGPTHKREAHDTMDGM
tara:strand:+ start:7764 stop:7931 length:168 start_codon:yes stop_codon:yes gene_type:complete